MRGRNLVETIMGGVVLVAAAIFLVFAYLSANLQQSGGYGVRAEFGSVDGLTPGSDVRIGGVKVGTVVQATIDPKDYRAVVTLHLDRSVTLPADSRAVVASTGLLGGKYIRLEPGRSATKLEAGGALTNTESGVVLEELLGKIIFLATDQGQGAGQGQGQGKSKSQEPDSGAPSQ